jgi:hypothetical protein
VAAARAREGVVGLPLAVAVLVLSDRDLARMRRGLLDPLGGRRRMPGTSRWGGLFLSVIGLLICGVVLLSLGVHGHV